MEQHSTKFINSYGLKNWYKHVSCLLHYYLSYSKNHPYSLLQQDASRSTVEYIKSAMQDAVPYLSPKGLLHDALSAAGRDGEIAEFGVYRGGSINHIATVMGNKTVWGFDSFEGLPLRWILPKGSFSLGGRLPKVRDNVKLIKGWFSETAAAWFADVQKISFLHIDCDLYLSVKQVLDAFAAAPCFSASVKDGVVIVFDDYFNQPFWQRDSHRAFTEFLSGNPGLRVDYMGYASEEISVRLSAG
jgi:hypothetical protein